MRKIFLSLAIAMISLLISCSLNESIVTVENAGSFLMDVEVKGTHKDVPVGEFSEWSIEWTTLDTEFSDETPDSEVKVTATYRDSSLTYGGFFEAVVPITDGHTTMLTIHDCQGWY